jgi:hypothetical protein
MFHSTAEAVEELVSPDPRVSAAQSVLPDLRAIQGQRVTTEIVALVGLRVFLVLLDKGVFRGRLVLPGKTERTASSVPRGQLAPLDPKALLDRLVRQDLLANEALLAPPDPPDLEVFKGFRAQPDRLAPRV